MTNNNFSLYVLVFLVGILTANGAIFLLEDYRHFEKDILSLCEKQGHIQSREYRINCSVEK